MITDYTDQKVGDYEVDIGLGKTLGEGAWGQVFVGRHASGGKDIAAKLIVWDKDLVTEEMDREAELMKKIPPHPNVLGIIEYIKRDVWKDMKKNKVQVQGWLILELCTAGNLAEYAEEKGLSVAQKVDLILQGSRGLQHLHQQTPAIIHHDIKLPNLLITGSEDDPVVKVADFGISKFFAHTRELSVTEKFREGTESYWAPELFRLGENNTSKYNKSVDVFAMAISGMTLLVARCGYSVQTYTVTVEVEKDKIKKGLGRHIYEQKITDVVALIKESGELENVKRFKTILAAMLAPDAQARLTIHEVVDRLTKLRSDLGLQDRTPIAKPQGKCVSPRLEKISPVPAGDKQEQKKAIPANLDKLRAGKADDAMSDGTDQRSHRRNETVNDEIPPGLHIPKSEARGKSATGKCFSPGREEGSPVPAGDKREQKKAILANMDTLRAGKADDAMSDGTDQRSHRRNETVSDEIPPGLRIPKSARGKSATGNSVSPGLKERSPVPAGDTQEPKKPTLDTMSKLRAGKAEDGTTDGMGPMSHKKKEAAPKLPPRLPIPQTEAPGKSATVKPHPPTLPIGAADFGESAIAKIKAAKEDKKRALARACEKGQLVERIPHMEGPAVVEEGDKMEYVMVDTTRHSDESTTTMVTKGSEDLWKEYPDRYSLTLEKFTCKYIKKFHLRDFKNISAKVEVKGTGVIIYKGKKEKDKQKAKRAKEEVTKVIDSIAPPQFVEWKPQKSDLKNVVRKYDSVAYMEIDLRLNALVVVTRKDGFDRIREELEAGFRYKKPSSVSYAKKDGDKCSEDHSTSGITKGAARKITTTEHPEEDDDEKRGRGEPVCKKPSKLDHYRSIYGTI